MTEFHVCLFFPDAECAEKSILYNGILHLTAYITSKCIKAFTVWTVLKDFVTIRSVFLGVGTLLDV